MKLQSSAFKNNDPIPQVYTCEGDDINPPLEFFDIPEETKSLCLIVEDKDAPNGNFVHWTIWNMDPSIKKINEGVVPIAVEGVTGFERTGWGGPCPPSGTHRYYFELYALDIKLNLLSSVTKHGLMVAMEGHILATAQLIGTYARRKKSSNAYTLS